MAPVWIRGRHPYVFRSGQWARISGLELALAEKPYPRPCYRVRFEDGVEDVWPVYDLDAYYEFADSAPSQYAIDCERSGLPLIPKS